MASGQLKIGARGNNSAVPFVPVWTRFRPPLSSLSLLIRFKSRYSGTQAKRVAHTRAHGTTVLLASRGPTTLAFLAMPSVFPWDRERDGRGTALHACPSSWLFVSKRWQH